MATSPVPMERKFALHGIDVTRKVFELCKMEAVSLGEGGPSGLLGSHRHGNATLCSFVVDFAFHGRFALPPGHYLSCYFHQVAPGSWCAGMPLHSGTMLVVLPDSPCELMLGPETSISLVMAPAHAGVARVIERNPDSFGPLGRQFSLYRSDCYAGTGLGMRYAALFDGLTGETSHGLSDLLNNGVMNALVDARSLDDLLARGAPTLSHAAGYRLHYPTLRKAVRFMRAQLHRDIYMEEVASAAQISDRSLRHAFVDLLGVSPARYLSLLRLHEASRRLSMHDKGRLSIKAVATSCGLWDLSRFAANYQRAFGEHPSDTVMRTYRFA